MISVPKLPSSQLAESREQYLRYAVKLWELGPDEPRDASWAVSALDVLCVLFSDS